MKYEEYIQIVLKKFYKNFNVVEPYKIGDIVFPYAAIYKERNERYFGSKKIVLDAVENNEICLFTHRNCIHSGHFKELALHLEASVKTLVKPTWEHMSTMITCIMITDSITDVALIQRVKKYRYGKSFLFNLNGWAKIRFILVDLSHETIYCSREGDKVKKVYEFTNHNPPELFRENHSR